MSLDFQVIYPAEAIVVTHIQELPSASPRQIDVLGQDFRAVDEVIINGQESPSVTILSQNRLIATVPEGVGSDPVQTVSVLSNRLTLTKSSMLRFRLGDVTQKTRGIMKLMQLFLKLLFTRPGRDIFAKPLGGDALRSLGRTFSKSEGGSIVSEFIIAVDRASRQIVALQARDTTLPRDERLLSAQVLSAQFDNELGGLIVSVELTNQAGRKGVANVEI
jgi:hypothetical protein